MSNERPKKLRSEIELDPAFWEKGQALGAIEDSGIIVR